jgi:hypothetical protein
VIHRVAGLAQDSGQLSLQLLGWEGIAAFPDINFFPHQMIHANSHSADDADGNGISILLFQSTKIAFHGLLNFFGKNFMFIFYAIRAVMLRQLPGTGSKNA